MIKTGFRFFLVNFMPFLNFCIGVGHIAVKIKKLHKFLLVLNFFFRLKSFFKTSSCRQKTCPSG